MPVAERRKPIQVQLAKVFEGELEGKHIAEPKYDGLRGVIIFKGAKGEAVTRTGLPVPNAAHIVAELTKTANFYNQVLDGELLADDWNKTQSIVKTQEPHPDALELKFYVFDAVSAEDWGRKTNDTPLHKRKAWLLPRIVGLKYSKNVPWGTVSNAEDVISLRDVHVEAGFEGIILKKFDAPYQFKKHKDWLKVKPISEGDFVIVDAIEGRGKHEGKLGALSFIGKADFEGKEINITSEVGTGFDDATRELLWQDYKAGKLVGRVVEVEYQEVTEDGALRFPAFRRIRDDK